MGDCGRENKGKEREEGGEDGRVLGGFQLSNLHDRLVCVALGLLHEPSLHTVHHSDQVDQDTKVLPRHPQELVDHSALAEFCVGRPIWCCDGLDALLKLLEHTFHRFHLTHHQVVADLGNVSQ